MLNPTYENDSLFITPELCEKKHVCKEGIDFLRSIAPDGFTVFDYYMGKVEHFPRDYVMASRYHLPFSESDKKHWEKVLQIVNSHAYYYCHHVTDCRDISDSAYCDNSDHVFDSQDVYDSNFVDNSTEVRQSHIVVDSNGVQNSIVVKDSEGVTNSDSIFKGFDIMESRNVFDSKWIVDSGWIRNCERVRNSLLCANLTNCDNKILCHDIDGVSEPMICNTVVSLTKFERVRKELLPLLKRTDILPIKKGLSSSQLLNELYNKTPPLVYFAESLDFPAFWREVKDIVPNFNAELAYVITYAKSSYLK